MKAQSSHALCAKAIRQDLKKAFPSIKFVVRSDIFAGGDSVRIEWIDGPTVNQIDGIVRKYQYGHFDGMYDCYHHSNSQKDIPQVKYVQTSRDVSKEIQEKMFERIQKSYNKFDLVKDIDESNLELKKHWGVWSARQMIYRLMVNEDLTNGLKIA